MRAAQISSYGGKDVLQITSDAPKPPIGAGQILVEVHAASVNPFDWKVREGLSRQMAPLTFPATLGGDLAGIVAEVGEGVQGFLVGQAVYGQAGALSGSGSFAEFAPVKAESISQKPESVDFVTAAAVPLTAVSAYQALVETMNLGSGQKILIHGGAGGIGGFAIQLAKHLGAYVAATASASDLDFVRSLGVGKAIDYATQKFEDEVHDFDAVFDTIGGDTYTRSFQVLKAGGLVVSMAEQPNKELMEVRKVTASHQFTQMSPERLQAVTQLVDDGVLKVTIDEVFPLEEAAEALEYLKLSHHRGKVVLKIKE